jgi:hypothetical protein
MDLNSVIKNPRVSVVQEEEYGTYLWKMPDGTFVADGDQNFLAIFSMRGDLIKIARLRAAAKSYGIEEGQPAFQAGMRMISDEEYQEQRDRMSAGEIPDEFDISALKDGIKAKEAGLTDD